MSISIGFEKGKTIVTVEEGVRLDDILIQERGKPGRYNLFRLINNVPTSAVIHFADGSSISCAVPPVGKVFSATEDVMESVWSLGLGEDLTHFLIQQRLTTIAQLCSKSEAEMREIRGLSEESLNDIKDVLAEKGMYFGMKFNFDPNSDCIPTVKDNDS